MFSRHFYVSGPNVVSIFWLWGFLDRSLYLLLENYLHTSSTTIFRYALAKTLADVSKNLEKPCINVYTAWTHWLKFDWLLLNICLLVGTFFHTKKTKVFHYISLFRMQNPFTRLAELEDFRKSYWFTDTDTDFFKTRFFFSNKRMLFNLMVSKLSCIELKAYQLQRI